MADTMTSILKWFVLATILILLLFVAGCYEKYGPGLPVIGDPGPCCIEIVMGTDTLYYLPGDSAYTTVVVILTNWDGNFSEGVKVAVALANPLIGILEFVDMELRDTTNALGRVELIYRCYATPGKNYISAAASGRSDIDSIVVEPAQPTQQETVKLLLGNKLKNERRGLKGLR